MARKFFILISLFVLLSVGITVSGCSTSSEKADTGTISGSAK